MNEPDLGSLLGEWAARTPSIEALILIGSRERAASDSVWRADPNSDWDFQIIAKQPKLFLTADWLKSIPGLTVRVYAPRSTRIGTVPKVNILFDGAEADLVIIPARALRLGRLVTRLGLHRKSEKLKRSLQDLAIVIRPGWKFLTGGETWDPFYRKIVAEVSDPRLSNEEAKRLADVFVCDYVWVKRKIDRGELLTAQRTLHRELSDTNFRLLHECRLREGLRSFPEARRIERLVTAPELAQVSVAAAPAQSDLAQELDHSARTCRDLMQRLVASAWTWPESVRLGS